MANHCSVVPIVLIVDVGIKVRVNVGVQTNVGVHVETAVETAARGLAVRIAPVHHWLLATHRHTHGVPAQRTWTADGVASAAADSASLASLVVGIYIKALLRGVLVDLVVNFVLVLDRRVLVVDIDIAAEVSELVGAGFGSRVVVNASADLVVVVDFELEVVLGRTGVKSGEFSGRRLNGRRRRMEMFSTSEASFLKPVKLSGGLEATVIELTQQIHSFKDLLMPLDGASLGGTDKLPDCLLLVKVSDDEFFLLNIDLGNSRERNYGLGGRHLGQWVEGQRLFCGELSGVPENFDTLEKQKSIMGENKRLLFFGDDGVSDVFEVKSLGVGSFGDELSDAFGGGGHHAWIETILLIHAYVEVTLRAVHSVLALGAVEVDIYLRSLSMSWVVVVAGKLSSSEVGINLGTLSWELVWAWELLFRRGVLSWPWNVNWMSLTLEWAVEWGTLMMLSEPYSRCLGVEGELGALGRELSWGSVKGDVSSVVSGWGVVLLVHINWL